MIQYCTYAGRVRRHFIFLFSPVWRCNGHRKRKYISKLRASPMLERYWDKIGTTWDKWLIDIRSISNPYINGVLSRILGGIMSNSVFNLSLPDTLRRHAEGRVRVGGYGSVAEYIRDLIRTDQRQNPVRHDAADATRSESYLASAARPSFDRDALRMRRNRY